MKNYFRISELLQKKIIINSLNSQCFLKKTRIRGAEADVSQVEQGTEKCDPHDLDLVLDCRN